MKKIGIKEEKKETKSEDNSEIERGRESEREKWGARANGKERQGNK